MLGLYNTLLTVTLNESMLVAVKKFVLRSITVCNAGGVYAIVNAPADPPAPIEVSVNTMSLTPLTPPPKLVAAMVMVSLTAYPEPNVVRPMLPGKVPPD